MTSVFV